MSIKINENLEHFARGYQRAVITDEMGDTLTVNVLPDNMGAFASIGDKDCVAINEDELKQLAAFFAQFL